MRIGFIGLGNMGGPMAKRLVAGPHEVCVFNRSAPAIQELVALGAIPAGSAAEAAAGAAVILTALPTPQSVESVYAELAAAAVAGQVYVDHSTVAPATTRLCADLIENRGAAFLDAPVSGGPEGAEGGTLTIMAGGPERAYRTALPVLELMAANVYHCGNTGAGTAMKLVNQLLVGTHTLAAAESYMLGIRLGVDPALMLQVIGNSYGASRMFARNVPRFAGQDFVSRAPARLLAKDLDLILAEIIRLKLPLLLGSVAWAQNATLVNLGLGEADIASVVRLVDGTARGSLADTDSTEDH
jgi:3-hydroxyisobutyrate dehydrogenase-like beta-hydroxyacid dehydrogenase